VPAASRDLPEASIAVATGEVDLISRCDLKTVHLLARRPGVRVEEATGLRWGESARRVPSGFPAPLAR
jgi:hypothetical protein